MKRTLRKGSAHCACRWPVQCQPGASPHAPSPRGSEIADCEPVTQALTSPLKGECASEGDAKSGPWTPEVCSSPSGPPLSELCTSRARSKESRRCPHTLLSTRTPKSSEIYPQSSLNLLPKVLSQFWFCWDSVQPMGQGGGQGDQS